MMEFNDCVCGHPVHDHWLGTGRCGHCTNCIEYRAQPAENPQVIENGGKPGTPFEPQNENKYGGWRPTDLTPEIQLEHGARALVSMSFTDGYGKLHIIWDDQQLQLVRDDGVVMQHWPLEVIRAAVTTRCLPQDNITFTYASSVNNIKYAGEVVTGFRVYLKPCAKWVNELRAQVPEGCDFVEPSTLQIMAEAKFGLFSTAGEARTAFVDKQQFLRDQLGEHDFTGRYDVYIEKVQVSTEVVDQLFSSTSVGCASAPDACALCEKEGTAQDTIELTQEKSR